MKLLSPDLGRHRQQRDDAHALAADLVDIIRAEVLRLIDGGLSPRQQEDINYELRNYGNQTIEEKVARLDLGRLIHVLVILGGKLPSYS